MGVRHALIDRYIFAALFYTMPYQAFTIPLPAICGPAAKNR